MNYTTSKDGARIAWTREGSGPPVVLVHGITENMSFWDPVAQRLAADRTVVRLDLRGHGASDPAEDYSLAALTGDVAAVIEAAGLERPDVVGHSLGGMVATVLGASYPVRSVVNVDQPLALAGFKAALEPIRGALEDPGSFEAVMQQLFASLEGDRLDEAVRSQLASRRRQVQAVVLGVWDVVFRLPEAELGRMIDEALQGFSAPYLALHGIDPGSEYADWLRARIPQAQVEVWPGYGHYPHLVDPDRFAERLRTFWAEA